MLEFHQLPLLARWAGWHGLFADSAHLGQGKGECRVLQALPPVLRGLPAEGSRRPEEFHSGGLLKVVPTQVEVLVDFVCCFSLSPTLQDECAGLL